MIQDQLEKAAKANEKERMEIIRELANRPDEALQPALDTFTLPQKHLWEVAAQVIRTIGYPKNAPAIPSLVAYVGNSNAPGWEMAVETLVDLGAPIVVPSLIASLWEKDRHQYWETDVEGISLMLSQVNREFAVMCGPTIVYLLSQPNSLSSQDLDQGFLLDVLEKIGPPSINYAIPVLIDIAKKEGTSRIGRQASALITSFSKQDLNPYSLLLPTIE